MCSMDGLAMCAGDHLDDAAMHMLGVEWFINVSRTGAHEEWKDAVIAPVDLPWSILLLAAGRASKMIAAKLATQFPTRTIIELGSALDPLFVGRTRSEQVEPEKAREYFKELL